jgi:Uncharacterized protein conserved in bacteria (DUF2252)
VAVGLQVLRQQPLGTFDRHGHAGSKAQQLAAQLGQSGNVMGDPLLSAPLSPIINHMQLVMVLAPIDAGEEPQVLISHRPCSFDGQDPPVAHSLGTLIQVLEARLPLANRRRPTLGGTCLPLDLEGHVAKALSQRRRWTSFLGWSLGVQEDRFYYWRQLRDMKGSADVDHIVPTGMSYYATVCGWTLARAHARSGDPIAIAAYLGAKAHFDKAIAHFAELYAGQNERDYMAFREAISSGRLEAREGV